MDDDEFLARFLTYWALMTQEQKNDFEQKLVNGYFDVQSSSRENLKFPLAVLN